VQTERTATPTLAVQTVAGIQWRELLSYDLNGDFPTSALPGESHVLAPYNDTRKNVGE